MPAASHSSEPAQRVARDGERQRPDERRALDVRDELGRPDRFSPADAAHERLDRPDDARGQLHDRLVVDDDLVPLERLLELAHDATVERRAG